LATARADVQQLFSGPDFDGTATWRSEERGRYAMSEQTYDPKAPSHHCSDWAEIARCLDPPVAKKTPCELPAKA
jgi:hypothetical protein